MSEPASFSESLLQRSVCSGRERWQVKELRRKHFLAEALEQELSYNENVTLAKANPLTGRVLVHFDPVGLKESIGELIKDALLRLTALHGINNQDLNEESDATAEEIPINSKTLLKLIRSTEGEKKIRREATALSVLSGTLRVTTPLMQGAIMACGLQGGFSLLFGLNLNVFRQLALLAAGYYASATLEKSFEYKRKQKWTTYANMVEESMRLRAYQHIHSLSLTTLTEKNWEAAELGRFVKEDSERVKRFIEFAAPDMLDKGLSFSASSLLLLAVSPFAFLLAVLPLPFMYRLTNKYNRENQELYNEVGTHEKELDRRITNSLSGLQTVKSYTAEDWEQNRLKEINRSYQLSHIEASKERSKYHSKLEYGIYLGISSPIIYSSYKASQGQMSLLAFSSIAFLLPRMILSTVGLDQGYSQYLAAVRSAHRLNRLLESTPDQSSGNPLDLSKIKGEIRFENVSFRYTKSPLQQIQKEPFPEQEIILKDEQPNELILNKVNLTIPSGSTVAFVGTTGSGKSTLIKLLLRFYEPTEGRILLDGEDIRQFDLTDLRRALAWVSQDVYLFEGSIAENIRYGNTDATHEDVARAAELAAADEFINEKEEGFEAQVGERGQLLSGGQRQRVSVARALLKNSPILILDEATSAVDNLTEVKMQKAIMAEQQNQTLMLVAHRLSSIVKADYIFLLEDGEIRESGTHETLLVQEGRYARLWRLQINHKE